MWIACSIVVAVMTLIAIMFPIAAWMFERLPTISELVTAVIGHYTLGLLGISISLFTQRSWIKSQSNALAVLFIWLMGGMMHTQVERWLPDYLYFLTYLFPPALPNIKAMLNPNDVVTMSASTLHVIVYVIILLSCYVYVSVKRKDVML